MRERALSMRTEVVRAYRARRSRERRRRVRRRVTIRGQAELGNRANRPLRARPDAVREVSHAKTSREANDEA